MLELDEDRPWVLALEGDLPVAAPDLARDPRFARFRGLPAWSALLMAAVGSVSVLCAYAIGPDGLGEDGLQFLTAMANVLATGTARAERLTSAHPLAPR
ncbi:MAG: hypothetical protein ACXVRH_03890 [Thermoleophilaceae bacterium]